MKLSMTMWHLKKNRMVKDIEVIRKLANGMVQRNYLQIKQDIQDIIQSEMERVLKDPAMSHVMIKK